MAASAAYPTVRRATALRCPSHRQQLPAMPMITARNCCSPVAFCMSHVQKLAVPEWGGCWAPPENQSTLPPAHTQRAESCAPPYEGRMVAARCRPPRAGGLSQMDTHTPKQGHFSLNVIFISMGCWVGLFPI